MMQKIKYDDGAASYLVLILISQLFFTNGILLFVGMAIFFWIVNNVQQPHKPSVFTLLLIYHFVQISAGIWLSNYLNKDVNYRSESTTNATIASYIGLLFLFLPIIYFQNKIPALSRADLLRHARKLSTAKTYRAYVISFFAMNALSGVAFFFPGFTQVIFSFVNIKWFFFLIFGFQVMLKKEKTKEFYIFCLLEFGLGFFSYFSAFKTVMFFLLFLNLALLRTLSFNKVFFATIFMAAAVFGGIFWTSIKGEYRNFLNSGSNTQVVSVEKTDAVNKLLELSQAEDEVSFNEAIEDFLERLQYTYHFAKTMDRVPSVIPHQNGANWGKTLEFVLTPRILNPNKGNYDASVKTVTYTGIRYMGASKGTSVSLGYFADGYIDFGYIGMMVPLLILGFIYGGSSYYFIKNTSTNYLFNFAVVGAMFMETLSFESDNIFIAGRVYVNLVVFFMMKLFIFPAIMAYIKQPVRQEQY